MEKIKSFNYLIIGAGISGLSFAHFLNDNNYVIIESENKPGGYCRTTKRNGFIWDYSGHFFHFKTDYWKKYFVDAVQAENIICCHKKTKILIGKTLVDFPFQSNIYQLPKPIFSKCVSDLYFASNKDGSNFLEMINNRFGKEICNIFLKPYNEKLYSCNLNELDKNAMGRFFPKIDKDDIFKNLTKSSSGSYNDYFMYPKEGCESFVNFFLNKEKTIHLNERVIEIDEDHNIIRTTKGKYMYKKLIITCPLNIAAKLFKNKKYREINFSSNQVVVFNIGFNSSIKPYSRFSKIHWIYFPNNDLCFYRVGFYSNILNSKKLSIYVEIGYKANVKQDEVVSLERVVSDLKKCHIIDDGFKILDYEKIIMNPGYVHINAKTQLEIDSMFCELNKKNVYFLGRYGKWTYSSIEDALIDSKKLADQLQEKNQYE